MKKNTQFSTSTRQQIRNKITSHSTLYSLGKFFHKICYYSTTFLHSSPNYLIIGASKSGTSLLYEYLIPHPNIKLAISKQIHYFEWN